jgi:hypothetical protein
MIKRLRRSRLIFPMVLILKKEEAMPLEHQALNALLEVESGADAAATRSAKDFNVAMPGVYG